jgi:hypothetical protein
MIQPKGDIHILNWEHVLGPDFGPVLNPRCLTTCQFLTPGDLRPLPPTIMHILRFISVFLGLLPFVLAQSVFALNLFLTRLIVDHSQFAGVGRSIQEGI